MTDLSIATTIAAAHKSLPGGLLPALHAIQDALGHVPQEEDPMRSVAPVDGFLRDHRL